MDWWPDTGLQEWLNYSQDPVPGILPRSIWPVKIKGQEIGTLPGLVDLAIDSGPNMTIWGFSKGAVAKVWQLDDGRFGKFVKERWIERDGSVREIDGDGDTEMSDASSSSPEILLSPLPLLPESFDGTCSFPIPAVFTTRAERHRGLQCNQKVVNYDSEGDILMQDLPPCQGSQGGSRDSLHEVALAHAGDIVYETFSRSERVYLGRGTDLVEELTGMARVDIEIS
jgi:hypothetical protein